MLSHLCSDFFFFVFLSLSSHIVEISQKPQCPAWAPVSSALVTHTTHSHMGLRERVWAQQGLGDRREGGLQLLPLRGPGPLGLGVGVPEGLSWSLCLCCPGKVGLQVSMWAPPAAPGSGEGPGGSTFQGRIR